MSAAKHTPGPWEPVSLLRGPGEAHARLVVRRLAWEGDTPRSEYLPGSFDSLDSARAAIAMSNGSMTCCRFNPCKHPGIGPCDMPAKATGTAS